MPVIRPSSRQERRDYKACCDGNDFGIGHPKSNPERIKRLKNPSSVKEKTDTKQVVYP